MIDRTISHYHIVEKLGAGGMGVVYKAEDTKLGRTVALKFFAAHLLDDSEARRRFQREAQAAAGLNHPNVCTVHELDDADGETFIAMALVEGESLEARIARGPLPIPEALDICRQVADGLQAGHDKGVVHRDIKPANVLINPKGHVTIVDFGLALLREASRLTRMHATMGTVAYMSPEQVQGLEVDHRSDIWALGCLLYETVCGRRPFNGQYEQALFYEIVNEEPEPLTGLRAGVPTSWTGLSARRSRRRPISATSGRRSWHWTWPTWARSSVQAARLSRGKARKRSLNRRLRPGLCGSSGRRLGGGGHGRSESRPRSRCWPRAPRTFARPQRRRRFMS